MKTRHLIIFTALVSAVLLEVGGFALQRMRNPYNLEVSLSKIEFEFDRKIGWRGRRNWMGSVQLNKRMPPVEISINKDGFRDGDWDQKIRTRPKAKRILVIGDSFIYGMGSPANDRVTDTLQKLYDGSKIPAVIFNAGISGYGTAQQFRLLPELLERLRPNVVILLLCENDIGDSALPYDHRTSFRVYKPFYNPNGDLIENENVPLRPSARIKSHWFTLFNSRFVLDEFYYIFQNFSYAWHGISNDSDVDFENPWKLISKHPETLSRFRNLIRKTNDLALHHHAKLYVGGVSHILLPQERPFLQKAGIRSFKTVDWSHWFPLPFEGHCNHYWSWKQALSMFTDLEGLAISPQIKRIYEKTYNWPNEIFPNNKEHHSFIADAWSTDDNERAGTVNGASFFIKPSDTVYATLWAKTPLTRVFLYTEGTEGQVGCQFTLDSKPREFRCKLIHNAATPMLLRIMLIKPGDFVGIDRVGTAAQNTVRGNT